MGELTRSLSNDGKTDIKRLVHRDQRDHLAVCLTGEPQPDGFGSGLCVTGPSDCQFYRFVVHAERDRDCETAI